ncbi:hypothetical protein ACFXO2_21730 [Streptomyces sp. NPDC059152]|uniref:hypothetical protein n=1 Tax=Streptomyces sp. NPDC059152 TaxID=3346742 RepID=UPI0036AE98C6
MCAAQLLFSGGSAWAAGANPWGCGGKVDHPHRSHTNPHAVNVHADLKCKARVPRYSIYVTLYRSRWWGWEKIGKSGYVSGVEKCKARAVANWEPLGACRHYKGVAEFMIAGGSKKITSTVFNYNKEKIEGKGELCVK